VPMPVVVRTRSYDVAFYESVARRATPPEETLARGRALLGREEGEI